METAFAGQPIGRPILGTPETHQGFRRGHHPRLSGARIQPRDRWSLAAAGDVEHAQIVDAARAPFRRYAAPCGAAAASRRSTRGGERRIAAQARTGQSRARPAGPVVQGRRATTPPTSSPHVLGGGLTSRLWQEVRETRGLAYSIDAFHWPFSDCGLFGIGAGTAGADVAELVDVTLDCTRARPRDDIERDRDRPRQGADEGGAARRARNVPAAASSGWRASSCAGAGSSRARRSSPRSMPLTVEDVREAGQRAACGRPDLAAVGPIKGLPPWTGSRTALARALRGMHRPTCQRSNARKYRPQSRRKAGSMGFRPNPPSPADKSGRGASSPCPQACRPVPIPLHSFVPDERPKRCGSYLSPLALLLTALFASPGPPPGRAVESVRVDLQPRRST